MGADVRPQPQGRAHIHEEIKQKLPRVAQRFEQGRMLRRFDVTPEIRPDRQGGADHPAGGPDVLHDQGRGFAGVTRQGNQDYPDDHSVGGGIGADHGHQNRNRHAGPARQARHQGQRRGQNAQRGQKEVDFHAPEPIFILDEMEDHQIRDEPGGIAPEAQPVRGGRERALAKAIDEHGNRHGDSPGRKHLVLDVVMSEFPDSQYDQARDGDAMLVVLGDNVGKGQRSGVQFKKKRTGDVPFVAERDVHAVKGDSDQRD